MRMKRNLLPITIVSFCLLVIGLGPELAEATPTMVAAGFGVSTPQLATGITASHGFAQPFGPLSGFVNANYIVEQSLGRISVAPAFGTPTSLVTGLSSPSDVVVSPGSGSAFGNFLFVAENGANRISKISNTGAVTTFATLAAAPNRLAFSIPYGRGPTSVFGNFLFATLANGQVVKIDSTGAVTTCKSGLSNPQGLVFASGGALHTTLLFVAETGANRLQKIDSTCTGTPFATSGLSAPIGLEISPGNGWGAVSATTFMLYVLNGSSISRVDQTGAVSTFATAFSNADTIRFGTSGTSSFFAPIDLWGFNTTLLVADSGTGTIERISIFGPGIALGFTGCTFCKVGDAFGLSLTVTNNSPLPIDAEIKGGFELPDGSKLTFDPVIGNNKFFEAVLPVGYSNTINPWVTLTMPAIPFGRYCYRLELLDSDLVTSAIATRPCFTVSP